MTFLSALALEMIATLSTAVVAVEIGLRLLYGRLAFEQAFFILLLAPEFYLPLRLLGLRFHAGMAGVRPPGAFLSCSMRQPPSARPPKLPPAQRPDSPPEIMLENVSFSYARS